MREIAIDIQTLARSPRALIVAIDAALFERSGNDVEAKFFRRVALDTSKGDVEGATIEWWMSQPGQWPKGEGCLLRTALEDFTTFYKSNKARRLWGRAAFDVPILHSAYLTCGLDVPWAARAPRDVRTLFDLAGMEDPGPSSATDRAKDIQQVTKYLSGLGQRPAVPTVRAKIFSLTDSLAETMSRTGIDEPDSEPTPPAGTRLPARRR